MARPTEEMVRAAYDAYCRATGGRSFDGHNLLGWPDLPERIKEAWFSAVEAGVGFVPPGRRVDDDLDEGPGRVKRFDTSDVKGKDGGA